METKKPDETEMK